MGSRAGFPANINDSRQGLALSGICAGICGICFFSVFTRVLFCEVGDGGHQWQTGGLQRLFLKFP